MRHALKPRATIIIAESKFIIPFDANHIVVRAIANAPAPWTAQTTQSQLERVAPARDGAFVKPVRGLAKR